MDEIFVGRPTTDYCVKETALDAQHAGFAVDVTEDCVRAVDVEPGGGDKTLAEMWRAGTNLLTSAESVERLASTQQ